MSSRRVTHIFLFMPSWTILRRQIISQLIRDITNLAKSIKNIEFIYYNRLANKSVDNNRTIVLIEKGP